MTISLFFVDVQFFVDPIPDEVVSCVNVNAIKETFQSWHHVTQIYFAGNHKIFFLLF